MRVSFSLILLGALLPHLAAAQLTIPPTEGTRVRLTAPALGAEPRVGRVVSSGADTLVVQTSDRFAVAVPVDQITRLESFAGRRPRKARFALIGAGVGFVGIVDPKYNALAGATLGALIGTFVGQVWRGDRWEPVESAKR